MMLMSQVDPDRSEHIKKRFYISGQDEFNCSSEPLNGLMLSAILDAMPSCSSSRKVLKHGYIADLVREGGISPCSLLLGLIYIRRLTLINQEYLSTVSSRDLFLVAMVIASKYMNDEGEMEALTNSEWSTIGCTGKSTVDQLERNFLKAIGWWLYVPVEEFYTFVGSAEARVAMEQAHRRGWLTYTDLSAVWDNSDVQLYMLKHIAKMAVSGVTLYLVCVSTLMAAVHALPLLSTASEPPAYTGHTHQLHQDPLRPAANLSSEQIGLHSQLVPTTTAVMPISWKEAWPGGGGVCPSDQLSIPVSLRFLLTPQDAVNSSPPVGVAGSLSATPLTWPFSFQWLSTPMLMDSNWKKLHNWSFPHDNKDNLVSDSSPYRSLPVCSTPYACKCNHTHTEGAAHCRARVNAWEPLFRARVETPQAEDLGYHYRGTFHGHLNSSPLHNESSMAGALTFIVRYLTPHWVA